MHPTAIVMNMFYTGLGIARSLGEQGVHVIGLSAQHRVYGNFTRYAKTRFCPDSRTHPDALLTYLVALGESVNHRCVIFPTRDDDLVFLDRFRGELAPYFDLVMPNSKVLAICLNKWETYRSAREAGVPVPKCWVVEGSEDLTAVLPDLTYPCVVKPVAAHHWRQGGNWNLVGARKAIAISSRDELLAECASIARADPRVLIQEMVAGGDEALVITACYLNHDSKWVAGFNAQKVVQAPEGFGTGCIVRSAHNPELQRRTARLLERMHFSGIAEVEYKWDETAKEYKLIEINPRPWDQHRLGHGCGIDLMYLAYCDYAGLPKPALVRNENARKWVAEDTFVLEALSLLWRRDPRFRELFRLALGKRIYAIWSLRDPVPLLAYLASALIPRLVGTAFRFLWTSRKRNAFRKLRAGEKHALCERQLEKERIHG